MALNSAFVITNHNIRLFCFVGMCFFLGLLTHVFSSEDGAGLGALKALFVPIALFFHISSILLLCISGYRERVIFLFKNNVFFFLSLIYVLLSALWSIDQATTIRRGIALIGSTSFGILIGLTYTRSEALSFFRKTFLIIISTSVFLAIFLPKYGTHIGGEFDGYWRGALSFKNQMGWIAAIFLVLWLSTDNKGGPLRHAGYLLGLLLGGVLLIKTHSSTGLIVSILGFTLLLLLKIINTLKLLKNIFIIILAISIISTFLFHEVLLEYILELLGKDLTLTGRTSIWLALIPVIDDHFYLGVGYSAFWPNVESFFGYSWMSLLNHAHNTYVELIVDLGIIGSVFCMVFLIIALNQAFLDVLRKVPEANIIFAVWCIIFAIGMSGKVFFVPNAGIWVLVVALYVVPSAEQTNKFTEGKDNG